VYAEFIAGHVIQTHYNWDSVYTKTGFPVLAEGHNIVIVRTWAASGIISFLWGWGGGGWQLQGISLAGFLGLEPIVTQLCSLCLVC
jgi:hypothetical protein